MALIEQIKDLVNRVENEDHWITIGAEDGKKGHHVLVKDGETNKEATERKIAEWEGKDSKDNKKDLSEYIAKGYEATKYFKNGSHSQKDIGYKLYKGKPDAFNLNKDDIELTSEEFDEFTKQKKIKEQGHDYNIVKLKDNAGKEYYELKKDGKTLARDYDKFKIVKYIAEKQDKKIEEYWEGKETKSSKKDEDKHQKVRDLEEKAYKEFKTMYDNYIDKDGMEGWGGIPASRFDKAVKDFNNKYQKAFKELESDRFVSFDEFARRENKEPEGKRQKREVTEEDIFGKSEDEKPADRDFAGMPKDKTVEEKQIEDGITESHDEYGRINFKKGNKWANVTKNGSYFMAAYGLTHKTGVSWEDEKGITHEQLLHAKGFKTEKGARKWALAQLKRITSYNSAENSLADTFCEALAEVILEQ